MNATVFLLFAVAVIGIIIAGAVWGFVRLVGKEKTRPIALGILGAVVVAFLILPALLVLGLVSFRFTSHRTTDSHRAAKSRVSASARQEFARPAIIPLGDQGVRKTSHAATENPPNTSDTRPAWVDESPRRVGGVYRKTAVSDRYASKLECDQKLNPTLREITNQYIDDLCRHEGAGELVDMDVIEIRRQLCKEEWTEAIDKPYGRMYQVHVLMEFDEAMSRKLRERFEVAFARWRLLQAGGGALAVLAALGVLYGYLTLDTATKGYYTKRLQAAAALAAIAAIVAAGLLLVA